MVSSRQSVCAVSDRLLGTVPVCGPMQDQLARSHHARPSSIALWPLVQVVPKMYSFAHQTSTSSTNGTPDEGVTVWLNHFPARAMRVERGRQAFVERGHSRYLLVRTAYRGRRWVSRFILRVRNLAKACGEAFLLTEAGGLGHLPLEGGGRREAAGGGGSVTG